MMGLSRLLDRQTRPGYGVTPIARFAVIGLLGLALMACSPEGAALPEPPPEASALPPDGSHEMLMRNVVTDLRWALESRYGDVEVTQYKLPVDTGWAAVVAYYEAELGQAWALDQSIPELRSGYRMRVWRRDDGNQALAVGLISNPTPGSPPRFRILLIAVPRDS